MRNEDMAAVDYAPGMRVIIRDEEWMVRKVETNTLNNKALHCVGISPLVKDKEAIFLTDLEEVSIVDPAKTTLVADQSPCFSHALVYLESQWRQQIPTDTKLHIGHRAAMDLMQYQLKPASIALGKPRQRILIADAVGLGKTLEAGILISELIARGKGRRILVVTVKSMMTQFQKEMWNRFTIPLVRLDSAAIQRIRSKLPENYNPFFYYDKTIVSIDTLKRDIEYRTYLENAYWDIIVIDEAQNVAERGDHQAQRSRLAKLLADRSDTMIMLSATPHDGRSTSFASLMNMLDPTAIADPENYGPEDIKGLCIRRFKKDIRSQVSGEFPERHVEILRCHVSEAEERAFDYFADMKLDMDIARTKGTGQLFKTSLEKALFSSPAACIKSIDARLQRLRRKYADNEIPDIHRLEELKALLQKVGTDDFSRYQELLKLLHSPDYGWDTGAADDRLVIFTERIETMHYVAEHLRTDLHMNDQQVVEMSGSMTDEEQQQIVENFGRTEAPVRVLVASDVASEGLNLHYLSHRMIHFDIPWSLMVFQQRNGRIDRYGQKKQPDIRYFLIESSNKDIHGDARILEILVQKEKQVTENLGDSGVISGMISVGDNGLIVESTIEKGSDADAFEQMLNRVQKYLDPFEQMMRNATAPVIEQSASAVTDETLYSDKEYLSNALKIFNEQEPHAADELSEHSGLKIRLNSEMKRRLGALIPPEAMPSSDTLILSDDKQYCMKAMSESMENQLEESAWPTIQYLWPLHPVFNWLNDKARLLYGRSEAPVLGLKEVLTQHEFIFIMAGSIPNEKSTPLVDEWFGLRFLKGQFAERMSMTQVMNVTHIRGRKTPNLNLVTQAVLDEAAGLRQPAIEQAAQYFNELYQQYQVQYNRQLDEELDKLAQWEKKKKGYYQITLKDFARKRTEQELLVDKLFDEFTEWTKQTLTIQDNPYLRIIAVFAGV